MSDERDIDVRAQQNKTIKANSLSRKTQVVANYHLVFQRQAERV